MSETQSVCPRCAVPVNQDTNRLVTERCGHQKCRVCLLSDELGCLECRQTSAPRQTSLQNETTESSKLQLKATGIPEHIQRVPTPNGGQQFHCSICGKYFRSRSQQYYHIHCGNDGAKQHMCNFNNCTKRFATRSHLDYHLVTHRPGVFICGTCSKAFSHQAVLRKHERSHQLTLVDCSYCHKRFRGSAALSTHMALHSASKTLPFKCSQCTRSYLTKSTLQQHVLNTHTGQRHECPICHKLYQRKSILHLHLKRHERVVRLECDNCQRTYSDADALARHRKQHTTLESYRCIHCDISTRRKDNMQRHVRNMHVGARFDSCVETIGLHDAFVKPMSGTPALPPTTVSVENSSVIKCVGNVKPVVVQAIEMQSTVDLESLVKPNKKTKYNAINHYRKILGPDDDDDVAAGSKDANTSESELPKLTTALPVDSGTAPAHTSLGYNNFSDMDCRKIQFKYA